MRLSLWLAASSIICYLWLPAAHGQSAGTQQAGPPERLSLEPAKLEADELANILGISSWTFQYSGGRMRCWLEITENGQKTIEPPKGLQVPAGSAAVPEKRNDKDYDGRILLWWHRSEKGPEIGLRMDYGTERGRNGSNFLKALQPDALWWGWKGWSGSGGSTPPQILKPREEFTLLKYDVDEIKETAKDPKAPRKITIELKAKFPAEQ
jgi:hypothetical protein